MARMIALVLLVLCAAGCTGKATERESRRAPTERERDSLIARSRLPGAPGVASALSAADSASARARRLDSFGE